MGAQNVLILRGVMDPVGASELDVGWLQSASLKVEDGKAIEVQLTDRLELPEQGIGAEAKGNWIPTGARFPLMLCTQLSVLQALTLEISGDFGRV